MALVLVGGDEDTASQAAVARKMMMSAWHRHAQMEPKICPSQPTKYANFRNIRLEYNAFIYYRRQPSFAYTVIHNYAAVLGTFISFR